MCGYLVDGCASWRMVGIRLTAGARWSPFVVDPSLHMPPPRSVVAPLHTTLWYAAANKSRWIPCHSSQSHARIQMGAMPFFNISKCRWGGNCGILHPGSKNSLTSPTPLWHLNLKLIYIIIISTYELVPCIGQSKMVHFKMVYYKL